MFFRTESFQDFIRFYPVVATIIGIHIFLWLTGDLLHLSYFVQLERLGNGNNLATADGEYWRLITPIFFHAGLAHMVFNSFSLVLFGPALEQMLGKGKFLLAYLGAGFAGNVGTFLLGPDFYLHVGASGAIFGLFGVYLYLIYAKKHLIDQANAQIVLTITVIGLVMTFIRPNINIYGHIFGLLGGLALGPIVTTGANRFSMNPARSRRRGRDSDVGFDPNRWNKRRVPWRKFLPKLLWGLFVILIIAGLLGRFI
ncbi:MULTISPECIES: rhomboid family protein [Pontibacillus]|uniref:Rhomboid family intramembrane serine protease n=1 Tax=Pontibacillus chungwhensis TaxID=265426 RepID=A0ABY8UXH9_9BACI|nr:MULTISPECIES: rhomboid family intramembrane serine protease [Pontibacillus]MCD5325846.1 rhomboid family intramembrane serine protease [Pontibacillus sp. HN14]WIF98376.1 rhomboid family intramembrane serine protease [Pontibacillus chungwhensis]